MRGTHCLLCYSALRSLSGAAEQIKALAHFTAGTIEVALEDRQRGTTSSGCGKPTLPALWPLHGPGGRSSTGRESLDRQMVSRPPGQGSQADLTCQPREFPGKFCPALFPHICPEQTQPRRPQLWAVLSAFIPRVLSQEARGFWG